MWVRDERDKIVVVCLIIFSCYVFWPICAYKLLYINCLTYSNSSLCFSLIIELSLITHRPFFEKCWVNFCHKEHKKWIRVTSLLQKCFQLHTEKRHFRTNWKTMVFFLRVKTPVTLSLLLWSSSPSPKDAYPSISSFVMVCKWRFKLVELNYFSYKQCGNIKRRSSVFT